MKTALHIKKNISLLKLSSLSIAFDFQEKRFISYEVVVEGGDSSKCVGLATKKRDGSYVVTVATKQPEEIVITTVAHELRHIWQYTNGILSSEFKQPERKWLNHWRGSSETPVANYTKKWYTEDGGYIYSPEEEDARWWADHYYCEVLGLTKKDSPASRNNWLLASVF